MLFARNGANRRTRRKTGSAPIGATLAELMKTLSWQAHSVRGFISGTLGKKMDLPVVSAKREDGARNYSIAK